MLIGQVFVSDGSDLASDLDRSTAQVISCKLQLVESRNALKSPRENSSDTSMLHLPQVLKTMDSLSVKMRHP